MRIKSVGKMVMLGCWASNHFSLIVLIVQPESRHTGARHTGEVLDEFWM